MTVLREDPRDYLRRLGESGDGPYDIAEGALMCAALDHGDCPLEPYRAHLGEVAESARAELRFTRSIEDAARALAGVIAGRYGYDGDRLSYDDPRNADFIAVIDRRRGLPVAVGIVYIHAARAAGLKATGLAAPGHFLLAVSGHGGEALIDPFNGGAALDRERLSAPPAISGGGAPDEPRIFEPVSDADVLLRLENNLKVRAMKSGERQRALEIVTRMALIAPRRGDLWLEIARMHEAAGALGAAIRAYDNCLSLARPGTGHHNEAALGLHALKRRLN